MDAATARHRLCHGAVMLTAVTAGAFVGALYGAGAGGRAHHAQLSMVMEAARTAEVDTRHVPAMALRGHVPAGKSLPIITKSSAPTACAIPAHANASASCTQLVTSTFPYLGHDLFLDACDHVYVPGEALHTTSPSLVFLHPRDIGAFGDEAVHTLEHDIVLVSNSNVDECLPYRSSADQPRLHDAATRILAHPRVVAWYGPNVVERHPKLKPLPLGNKWNWRLAAHHAEDENKGRILKVLSSFARDPDANFRAAAKKPNLLLTRMDAASSDSATYAPTRRHRRAALQAAGKILQTSAVEVSPLQAHEDDSTCVSNGDASADYTHVDRLAAYLQEMRSYKFVLSPPGNGLDTHRTWEALLMGAIPVVESSPAMDSLFDGLPVLVLKSWQELTTEVLEAAYDGFHRRQTYCWGKLYAPFYLRRMRQELERV